MRWELIDNGHPVEMEVHGPTTVNDTASVLACAMERLGLAYVLERIARDMLGSGALMNAQSTATPVLLALHLYYPSRRQVPLKQRCFVDFMAARLRSPKDRHRAARLSMFIQG